MMDLSSYIINCYNEMNSSEQAESSSKQILKLRDRPDYIQNIIMLLTKTEQLQQNTIKRLIIQLKTCCQLRIYKEKDLDMMKQKLLQIIIKHVSKQNERIIVSLISQLAVNYGDKWFNKNQFLQSINKINKDNYQQSQQFFSILIGIPQAYRFQVFVKKNQTHLETYNCIFQALVNKTQNCYPIQMSKIVKFAYYFILSSHHQSAHQMGKHLPKFMRIGAYIMKQINKNNKLQHKTENDQKYIKQLYDVKQQLLILIHEWIKKQFIYKKQINKKYHYDLWKNNDVQNFFTQLLTTQFYEQEAYKNYINNSSSQSVSAANKIWLYSIKLLSKFVIAVRPRFLLQHIQNLMYSLIPLMLFNMKNIQLQESVYIMQQLLQQENPQYFIRKKLLQLWANLGSIDITKLQQKQVIKYANNHQVALVQSLLPSFTMHMKFLFQKLSQTEVYFSPFIYKKELQNVWQNNNPQWLIVAFDLLKSINYVLQIDELHEIKKSIPQILLSYIMPNLENKNPKLQASALSVILTYKTAFVSLKLPQYTTKYFQQIINLQLFNPTKCMLLKSLKNIHYQRQLSEIIRKNIDKIISSYIQTLIKLQNNQQYRIYIEQLGQSFNQITIHYHMHIKQLDKYIQIITNHLLHTDQGELIYIQQYMQFIKQSIYHCGVRNQYANFKNIAKNIFHFTLNHKGDNSYLLHQMYLLLATYIDAIDKINYQHLIMFGSYCYLLTGFNKQIMNSFSNQFKTSVLKSFKKQTNQGMYEYSLEFMTQILWVLQMFIIKQRFTLSQNKYFNQQPLSLYLSTVMLCLQKMGEYKNEDYNRGGKYMKIVSMVLNGYMSIIEDYIENFDQIQTKVFQNIWEFSFSYIFAKNQQQFIECSTQNLKQLILVAKQRKQWDKINYLGQLQSAKYKLIQFWSICFWFLTQVQLKPKNIQILEIYFCLLSATNIEQVKTKTYKKRVILGLSAILQINDLNLSHYNKTLNLLIRFVSAEHKQFNKNLQKIRKKYKRQNYFQGTDSWYSNSQQQQEQYFDDDQFNQQQALYFDLCSHKLLSNLDDFQQLQNLTESIRIFQDNSPQMFKSCKDQIHKLRLMIDQCNYNSLIKHM